ncbi:hypothetical protein PRZ48_009536 [Zasmidium cellare]|uniref:BTB domain-containing protein n=1 Tax=Zasmidium cellare TaxID=395010 RepID=A0ABR0EBZ3_ZASCE|nr:hypothetical protein PRZ48_009536 [Zasmidium cellare]
MAQDSAKLALSGAVSRFLDSPDLADFEITCLKQSWKVHRFLLCLHSDVFQAWFTGGHEEATKGKANLSEHEPEYVGALVKYLYTFEYDVDTTKGHGYTMNFHIIMCVISDQVRSQPLPEHPTEKQSLPTSQYNLRGLAEFAFSKFKGALREIQSPSDIAEAYLLALGEGTTTRLIREAIARFIFYLRETILPTVATDESKQLEEVMRSHPDLALAVIKKLPTATGTPKPLQCQEKDYMCPGCRKVFKAHLANVNTMRYDCPTASCTYTSNGAVWNCQNMKR